VVFITKTMTHSSLWTRLTIFSDVFLQLIRRFENLF